MFNRNACEINNDNNVNIDDTEQEDWEAEVKNEPVSYTHLTLPTKA